MERQCKGLKGTKIWGTYETPTSSQLGDRFSSAPLARYPTEMRPPRHQWLLCFSIFSIWFFYFFWFPWFPWFPWHVFFSQNPIEGYSQGIKIRVSYPCWSTDPTIHQDRVWSHSARKVKKKNIKKILDFLVGEADAQKSCLGFDKIFFVKLQWTWMAGQIESFQWIYMDLLSSKL